MPDPSRKPFHETLSRLLIDHDVSAREVGRRTSKNGWGTYQTISLLARGEMHPTMEGMEAIARALQIRPEFFPEYRMEVLRKSINPKKVSFRTALKNLEEIESLRAGG